MYYNTDYTWIIINTICGLAVVDAIGLAPVSIGMGSNMADAASNGWGRRPKEQEFLENSQITSIDFLQTGGSAVSTGLALSLDDRRAAASSGESPLLLLPMVDEEIAREVQRMDAEMDRFIRTQVRAFVDWFEFVLSLHVTFYFIFLKKTTKSFHFCLCPTILLI